jgi:hypothetical protein
VGREGASPGSVVTLRNGGLDTISWKSKLAWVDFLGSLMLISAIFTLVFGIETGSNVSWKSPKTILCLAIAPILFGLFALIESKAAVEPFAPARVVLNRKLWPSLFGNFFCFAGWLSVTFTVPLYVQAADNLKVTHVGPILIPGAIGGVVGSIFAGYVMKKTGRYFGLTLVSDMALSLGVGAIILCTLWVRGRVWVSWVALVTEAL